MLLWRVRQARAPQGYITQWQPEVDFGLGTSVNLTALFGAMVIAEVMPLIERVLILEFIRYLCAHLVCPTT